MNRILPVVAGAALLAMVLVTIIVDEGAAAVGARTESRGRDASSPLAVAASPAAMAPAFEGPNAAAHFVPIAVPAPAASAGDDESAVRLSVSAPAFVEPGSPQELIVGIAAPRGARWVDLAISADLDVVELRDATRGERGVREGVLPGFEARISALENRIDVRAEVSGQRSGGEATSVAIVRFEGMAPGIATVTVSDVTVSDVAGTALPIASPSAQAEVVVLSGPI